MLIRRLFPLLQPAIKFTKNLLIPQSKKLDRFKFKVKYKLSSKVLVLCKDQLLASEIGTSSFKVSLETSAEINSSFSSAKAEILSNVLGFGGMFGLLGVLSLCSSFSKLHVESSSNIRSSSAPDKL